MSDLGELSMIVSIKDCARKRVEAGELDLEPLADYMASLSEHELTQVRYHSNCRKMIVLGEFPADPLRRHCEELRQSRHVRGPRSDERFEAMPDYFPQIEETSALENQTLFSLPCLWIKVLNKR